MSAATINTKGQTIPANVQATLGIVAGDRVESGRFELIAATQPVTALKGVRP